MVNSTAQDLSMFPGLEPWGFQYQNCTASTDCYAATEAEASTSMVCRAFIGLKHPICHCDVAFGLYGKGCVTPISLIQGLNCIGIPPSIYIIVHLWRIARLFVKKTIPRKLTAAWFALITSIIGLIACLAWLWIRMIAATVTTPQAYDTAYIMLAIFGVSMSLIFQLATNCIIAVAWLKVMQGSMTRKRVLKPKRFIIVYSTGIAILIFIFFFELTQKDFTKTAAFGLVLMVCVGVSVKLIGRNLAHMLLTTSIPKSSRKLSASVKPNVTVQQPASKTHSALMRCLVASRSMSNRMFITAVFIALNAFVPRLPPRPYTHFHPANVLFVTNPFFIAITIVSVVNYVVHTVSDSELRKSISRKISAVGTSSASSAMLFSQQNG